MRDEITMKATIPNGWLWNDFENSPRTMKEMD